jgi:uncharacterized protein (DUF342 family)
MQTLRTSQQSTIEHYESLLTKLREKSLNAHHLIDGQIEIQDSRLKSSETELVKYKKETIILQQKVMQLDSFLANYSRDQEELAHLQLENQDLQRKMQRLRNGMTPEHKEYEQVESKIIALERWHKNKEVEIKRRLEVYISLNFKMNRSLMRTREWKSSWRRKIARKWSSRRPRKLKYLEKRWKG